MAVKVLGPMDTGDAPLGPRERSVLAALIVRHGATVAPAELAAACWGDEPPVTWAQQVRNSVARIRSRLGHAAVETVSASYRLGLDLDTIDAVRFERLVSDARSHALHGDHERAVDVYRRALALWRGTPLQDVAAWAPAVVEAMRLGQIRASAEEELLDARLRAGDHRSVIPDAERLVREEPLREDRWAILALANYRAGRQADALATVRAARARLAEELGIEPGARLTAMETAMLRQDPDLLAPTPTPRANTDCPFPGLRAFDSADAEYFLGRESDIDTVLERLKPGSVVTIVGGSGSGKSSLARAGVAVRLRAAGRPVESVGPGHDAAAALRAAAARAAVVLVDQFEELLAGGPDATREFCVAASEVLENGRALLLTVRSDALDAVRALPLIGDAIGRGVYVLGPLSPAGCREALEEPARRAGLRLEPGLVELALRDAGDRSTTLPHLSHAMRETWQRREGSTLTVEGYEASGGIAGAIAQSAEDVFRGLSEDEQAVCRSVMLRLIERGSDGVSTRRRIPSPPMLAEPRRRGVIQRLADARLLSVDADTVTVAHEAVATAWPRLDHWLDEDLERSRVLRIVESAAGVWDAEGRSDEDLLRGARLHVAQEWRDASDHDLTPAEVAFLDASSAHEASDVKELQTRAARERSRNRSLRLALAGSAVLLVGALVAGGVAVVSSRESAQTAADARIGETVATSLALRSSDMDLAALVAAEAYRRWPEDPRVRSALLGILSASDGIKRKLYAPDARRATFTALPYANAALAVSDTSEGPATSIVDTRTGEVLRAIEVELPESSTQFARDVWVSANGRVAAIQTPAYRANGDCCLNHLTFVDLSAEEVLSSQSLDIRTGSEIALGQDGTTAYLAHPLTASVTAIDTRTGAVRATDPATLRPGLEGDGVLGGVAILDDATVAASSAEGVLVVDAASLEPLRNLVVPAGTHELDLAVAADGLLLTGGAEGASAVDTATGSVAWSIGVDQAAGCTSLAAMGDGTTFVCAGLGEVREFRSADGSATGRHLRTQLDWVTTPTMLSDDAVLLSAPLAALTMVWARDGAGVELITPGRVAVDRPDSRLGMLPTADRESHRLWDETSGSLAGEGSEWMAWVGEGMLARFDTATGYALEAVASGATTPWDWTGSLAGVAPESWVLRADYGPHGFVVASDRIIPFDPRTGAATLPPLYPLGPGEDVGVISISETADGSTVAATWWNARESRTETTLFDTHSGEILRSGLHAVDTTAIAGTDILSAGDQRLDVSPLATLEPTRSLSRPAGGSMTLSVSDDGRTALNSGYNGMVTIYDLERGIRLGDPIAGERIDGLPAAFLAPDGLSMIVNTSRGATRWTLDPATQFTAACAIAGREFTPQEWTTYFGWAGAHTRTCG